ncbi:hypothetical protein [Nonomuraea sp. SYSU D8015]|nr:hypothetical protein [Nonomuraea sp. SYSU D8015]
MTVHQHVAARSWTTQALRAVVVLHVVALLFGGGVAQLFRVLGRPAA